MHKPSIAIIGCGSVGTRLAEWYRQRGIAVSALVQRAESVKALDQKGIQAFAADLDSADSLSAFPWQFSHYHYFVPPQAHGDDDPRMRHFLAALRHQQSHCRLVYLSTTAVYGNCQGQWVDETRPPNPESNRGKRRYHAEQAVRQWAGPGREFVILRVGGIYGPGRLPEQRLRDGLPVLAQQQSPFVNRIHEADLVQVCDAAALRGKAGSIYNVSDGHPSTMTAYFNAVADVLGLPRPPQLAWPEAEQQLTPALLSYLRESRRLDNTKLVNELGIDFRYPDLARGLADLPS